MGVRKGTADRCIYCQSKANRTRDHIIPRGLGGGKSHKGKFVVPKGSCDLCQKRHWEYERESIRRMFSGVAFHHGLHTSSKPGAIDLTIIHDGHKLTVSVESGKEPGLMCVPVFPEPGILRGGDADELQFSVTEHRWFGWHSDVSEKFEALGGDMIWAECEYDLHHLARLLCKIAHGVAVLELGYDWTPFALPVALRVCDFSPYLVGTRWMAVPKDDLHFAELSVRRFKGQDLFVVHLWLFTATSQGEDRPVFEIVVGRPKHRSVRSFFLHLIPGIARRRWKSPLDPHLRGWPNGRGN